MRTQIQNFFGRFRRDESGAAMVEYGVALLVVVAIGITLLTALGGNVSALVQVACDDISAGVTAADGTAVDCV